ncbi:immunity protein Imm33 domain-containing protein [Virgisporangium aliadipatigenens]|uniref:immunity protein Imm33 domain-containing protein n=1 Tax=Virgisporangium aliadipatigenens TaxID=741659 RepID=UPI001943E850|nr:hypothetical protein [Virgisporangium aliadipatigenens]
MSWTELPINGLRHPLRHLVHQRPELMVYLALPAGWRFLLAPGYEDVWSDGSLLEG